MHTSSTLVLVLAVFGASLVEMVEALTIVVAAGVSRGWRSALEGAAAAALRPRRARASSSACRSIRYIPIDALRVVVGALLLVLGLSWLRKAILRSSGHKAHARRGRDLRRDRGRAQAAGAEADAARRRRGAGPERRDAVGFAVAFKGVFLEGTEVVLIVISLGAAQHRLGLAALAAAAAVVLVAIVGLVVARQLSEVPENTIKTAVGVMLTSFGVFWVGEGAGVHWPGSDLAIPVLVGFFVVVYFAFTAFMRTQLPAPASSRERRRRDDASSGAACGPSATSGGTSSSATRPSWRWPPAHRRAGLPAGRRALGRGAILLPLVGGWLPLRQHATAAGATGPADGGAPDGSPLSGGGCRAGGPLPPVSRGLAAARSTQVLLGRDGASTTWRSRQWA